MRKAVAVVWVLFLIIGIIGPIPKTGASETVDLSRGLVAYYSFDHCDARDDSGNGHDGEIYGNPECVDGVLGKAFEFDGGSYVRIAPSNELDNLNEFTISMLIRTDKQWGGYFGLIDFYNRNYDGGWGLEIFSSGKKIQIYDYIPHKGFVRVPVDYTFNTGTWYFVTVTYDGQNVKFYVDGKLIGVAKLTEELTTPSDIFIGYNPSGGNEYNYGDFDEVRIYNRALSEEEVKALYEQGVGGVSPRSTQPKTVEYLPKEDLSKWKYYREVTIKEQSGQTLENFQVLIELNSSNFDFSKAKPDGSDVRIVDESGNFLPYWIEEWNLTAKRAKIWTIIPKIPANGEVKLRLYYGNPNAQSRSDGDKVFEFFDDFNGNQLDTKKWHHIGRETPTVAKGHLVLRWGTWLGGVHGFNDNIVIETKYDNHEGDHDFRINLYASSATSMYQKLVQVLLPWEGGDSRVDYIDNSRGEWTVTHIYTGGLYVYGSSLHVRVYVYDSKIRAEESDGTVIIPEHTITTVEGHYIGLQKDGDDYVYLDWIAVRKYAPKDPIAIVGSEVSTSGGTPTTPTNTQTVTPTSTLIDTGMIEIPGYHPSNDYLQRTADYSLQQVRELIKKVKALGYKIRFADYYLTEAKKYYDLKDYKKAKQMALDAWIIGFTEWQIQYEAEIYSWAGIDTTAFMQAYYSGDLTGALDKMKASRNELPETGRELFDSVEGAFETVKSYWKEGIRLWNHLDGLEKSNEEFKRGNVEKAKELADEYTRTAADIGNMAREVLNQLKELGSSVFSEGRNGKAQELFERAMELFERGEFEQAKKAIVEIQNILVTTTKRGDNYGAITVGVLVGFAVILLPLLWKMLR